MEPMDAKFMSLALSAAQRAAEQGEVPVGAVITLEGDIVGTGFNCREGRQDPLGHA